MLLLGLCLGLFLLFIGQWTTPGQEKLLRPELAGSINFDKLFSGITVESVGRTHRRIVQFPSRLAGTAGDLEVAADVEQEFRRLKMDDVLVQRYPVTVPVTKWCRLSDKDGGELAGVSLVPFWPNHVRTCTTGPEGIVGRVIDVGTGTLEELDGKSIRNNIALARMTPGFAWLAAAKLGAKAILFRETANPDHYRKKILHFPGNMPRFLTMGTAVEDLVGEEVRIDARVDWEIRTARNVYGVLHPKKAAKQALVLMGFTDSWSVVPDLAPGAYEACSVTTLLEAARALTAQREHLGRGVIFVACSGRGLGVEGSRRMVDALGLRDDFAGNYELLKKRLAESESANSAMEKAVASVKALEDVDYWQLDDEGEGRLWVRGSPPHRAFTSVVGGLIDRYVAVAEQEAAMAKLAWRTAGRPDKGPA
ncbi:MAG: M28 family peptidase, partial [Phycisphaerae bacterium]|nr:M28 family peptidase [Phycisphaerae bacterium]